MSTPCKLAKTEVQQEEHGAPLSKDAIAMIDHIVEIFALEFVEAMKTEVKDESSDIC